MILNGDAIYTPYGNVRQMFDWLDGLGNPPPEVLVEGPAGTGKTRAVGEWLYDLCGKYANARVLVVRRYRADLHKGFQRTFEDMVLWPGNPLLTNRGGGRDDNRSFYRWPNGSTMTLGHMEDPQRWYSSEWDVIWWNEAVECRDPQQWVKLGRALRKGTRPTEVPFRLLGGDTNPNRARHFLNRRCKEGRTHRIVTRHRDNPSLEPEYLERLRAMEGLAYRHLYLGEWCDAEGRVFSAFDTERDIVQIDDLPDCDWYAAGMDFGDEAPGSIVLAGFVGDERAYIVGEHYRRKLDLDAWAANLAAIARRLRARNKPLLGVFADSAEPRSIRFLNNWLEQHGEEHIVRGVRKRKMGGEPWNRALERHINTLFNQERVKILDDPRRLIDGPDPTLKPGRPRSLTDELEEFVYKQPRDGMQLAADAEDQPDPTCQDHSIDGMKYLLASTWLADHTPEPPDTGLPDDTAGAILKHDEVWRDSLPAWDSTYDYAPASAFRKRRL
jgi:phage terminase large subunit